MKIEKRKRNDFKNLANREKKEICCLKILKIEKRKRNENTILQLEREKHESFLLEIFSRSRLLSMSEEEEEEDNDNNEEEVGITI